MTIARLCRRSQWPAAVVALILTSPLIWWSLDRRQPAKTIAVALVPKEVPAGAIIHRVITVDRDRVCPSDPDITILDGARVRWTIEAPAVQTPGVVGLDTYKVPVQIPPAANPGPAEMRVTLVRRCNPIQTVFPLVEALPPIPFVILPPEKVSR